MAVVDVYSGRPNPTWVLDAAAQARVVATLAELPPGKPGSPSPSESTLGFRSITVSNLDTSYGRAARVEVRVGTVILSMAAGQQALTVDDAQSRTLQLLLQEATGHVDGDVLNSVREQI